MFGWKLLKRSRSLSVVKLAGTLLGISALIGAGCQFPKDVEGTLDRVSGGTMRVGVINDPPWVNTSGKVPRGVEPTLVRRFAREIDAEIEWFEGTQDDLVAAMRGFQIDLLIGGLTRASPASMHVGLTRPYIDTEVEYAVEPGQELPDDLDGVRVWVVEGSEAASLMRREEDGAIPVYVEAVEDLKSPALLDSYDIEPLGLRSTDNIKRDHEHAMGVPSGENAMLVELDNFLLDRGQEAEALLAREAAR